MSSAPSSGACAFHLVRPALKLNVCPGFANLSIGPVWPETTGRTAGFLDLIASFQAKVTASLTQGDAIVGPACYVAPVSAKPDD